METINFWQAGLFTNPETIIGFIIMSGICYLIGSINAGQLLSLMGSKNLGEEGSKSFGATNAGRIYGTWAFILVFVFDLVKSILAVYICMLLIGANDLLFSPGWLPLAVTFVIIGHCWPIYFGFKGGKGVASAFGCVLALNWIFALIAIIVFIIVKLTNGWTSNASIAGTGVGVLLAVLFQWVFVIAHNDGVALVFAWSLYWTTIPAALIVGGISIWRHWPNIKEMIDGVKPWVRVKEEKK